MIMTHFKYIGDRLAIINFIIIAVYTSKFGKTAGIHTPAGSVRNVGNRDTRAYRNRQPGKISVPSGNNTAN